MFKKIVKITKIHENHENTHIHNVYFSEENNANHEICQIAARCSVYHPWATQCTTDERPMGRQGHPVYFWATQCTGPPSVLDRATERSRIFRCVFVHMFTQLCDCICVCSWYPQKIHLIKINNWIY